MRISPVGIIGRNLDAEQIRRVAIEVTRSTHVHPESIDGSTIISTAIAYCFHREAKDIDRAEFLKHVCKCNIFSKLRYLEENKFHGNFSCHSRILVVYLCPMVYAFLS